MTDAVAFPPLPVLPTYPWMRDQRDYPKFQAQEIAEDTAPWREFLASFPGLDGTPPETIERLALHAATMRQAAYEEGITEGERIKRSRDDAERESLRRFAHNAKTAMA